MDYLGQASSRELFGARVIEEADAVQYGVIGMKWGKRRSSKELKAAAAQRTDTKPDGDAKPKVSESAPERYARLAGMAKGGGAKSMSEEDLKFFNARTDAIKKVDALNKQDPSWINKTIKTVGQTATQKGMQTIADAAVDKFISGPIVKQIKNTAAGRAAAGAAAAAASS